MEFVIVAFAGVFVSGLTLFSGLAWVLYSCRYSRFFSGRGCRGGHRDGPWREQCIQNRHTPKDAP